MPITHNGAVKETQFDMVKRISGLTSSDAVHRLCADVKWYSCHFKLPYDEDTVRLVIKRNRRVPRE